MAETAVIPIAKSVLELLSSPALKEFRLLRNSKKELNKLEATIRTINCVLEDAEKKQLTNLLVKDWLSKLRAVMYEADDLFDELAAKALRKKTMTQEVRLFLSKSNQLGFKSRVAHEVKAIRDSLDAIANDMNQFRFISQPPVDQQVMRVVDREPQSSVLEEDVIGREDEKRKIIKMLVAEREVDKGYPSVVAVIGIGGLGKTALAQLVYNDESVKQNFELRIWVSIRYFSKTQEVLKAVIASSGKQPDDLGLEPLQKQFRSIIKDSKYLLVLDDVWDESIGNWPKIKPFLKCGKNGSKVLVTTRSLKVAQCMEASKSCHHLGVLDEGSAWSLFVKMAFDEGELSKHPELVSLGWQIVHKCGYVPLALKIAGRLLRYKEKEEKTWSRFLDNGLREVIVDDPHTNILHVLMASYNHLPPNLKLCFAYCSLFPKDHVFSRHHLVSLWLAQGFIQPSPDNQQGEYYFSYLVDRCFFHEAISSFGDITAKMHDLVHDLAIHVARTEIIVHCQVPDQIGYSVRYFPDFCDSSKPDCSLDYIDRVLEPKKLRTLLFPNTSMLGTSSINMLLTRFRMLRTLQLKWLSIESIPDSIGKLIHLRYLDLSYNDLLKSLPSSICKLHHLMMLILEGCKSLQQLPPEIGRLVNLRQLCLDKCVGLSSLPLGFSALTSLVYLDRLIVDSRTGGLRCLKDTDNLCGVIKIELPIEGWPSPVEDAKGSNMSKKQKLHTMILEWKQHFTRRPAQCMDKDEALAVLEALRPHDNLQHLQILSYSGSMLSSWVCSLQHIKVLILERCTMEYIEDGIKEDHLLFPCLEVLSIQSMPNLRGWWRHGIAADDDGMSKLPCLGKVSKVNITWCPSLVGQMPLFENTEYLELYVVDAKLVKELLVPNSIGIGKRLKQLKLGKIDYLSCLPEGWISHLTNLKILIIEDCNELSWVSRRGISHLTSLQVLYFKGCHRAVFADENSENELGASWKAMKKLRVLGVPYADRHFQEELPYLTSLESLNVAGWEPGVHHGEIGYVELPFIGIIALQKLRRLQISFGVTTSCLLLGVGCLRFLQDLDIGGCKELHLSWTTLLITMEKLVRLGIHHVRKVIAAESLVVQQQSQLQHLCISGEARWMRERDMPWTMLRSLLVLKWVDIRRMEHLPDGIQHLTSLISLHISDCDYKLRSLPNWMTSLTSLEILEIDGCSEELESRCEEGTGADWHLIRHVTRVMICSRGRAWRHRFSSDSDDVSEGIDASDSVYESCESHFSWNEEEKEYWDAVESPTNDSLLPPSLSDF